jgi:hypothetical protein
MPRAVLQIQSVVCLWVAAVSLAACSGCSTSSPSDVSSGISLTEMLPATGSNIRITQGSPPGAFITRGSGQLSVRMSLRWSREVDYAQLYLYLYTADGSYCGQNLPDTPAWGPFPANKTMDVTVSAFQVFRIPCDVTAIRAMLHVRNNGLLIPPTPAETVADATFPANYAIRQ